MDKLFIVDEEETETESGVVVETESAGSETAPAGREMLGSIWLAAVGAPTVKIRIATLAEAETAYAAYRDNYRVGALAVGHVFAGEMLVARITRDGVRWSPEAIAARTFS